MTLFLLLHVLKMSSFSNQHERKRWTQLADNTFSNSRPRAAHLLLMHHFSSSTYDLKTNTINVTYVTNFQCFNGLGDFLSWHMRSQYKFFAVNGQTSTSAFHKVVSRPLWGEVG